MSRFGVQGSLRAWDRFDGILALAAFALVGYGLVLIYSGSLGSYDGATTSIENPVVRQGLFAFIAIIAMFTISRFDYHVLLHYAWWLYGASILLMVALIPIGQTEFGSTRWFDLGPIQFQPSEFAKITTVLLLARFLGEQGGDARDLRVLAGSLAITAPVLLLVFVQPDLGTSIIFATIWLGMVVVAGIQRRHVLFFGAVFVALLPFIWTFTVADYQIERISVLLDAEEDPLDAGYNPIQSQIAVGSGQLFGKGLTNGEQTQLDFLKVKTKDYIFSVLGEELGFAGAIALFALFILLLMRGVRAAQIAGDVPGQLVAAGVVITILMQAFINIAVNLSIFPVTGLPLPFVSQGGSSLVTLFIGLGIIQSIVMRHRAYRQF
ncbi:MAG: rod shape-determining protein RodA [Dehalococcoidia bacterium]|nr:rod shape-determining protein RodA [Dehalococcoidia bacterium]|tara:strand:+ start:707 stop:1843 length:1137 start_codon:yes stop_codon:yes gene_type:complete